jgi:hypothetical protein
VQDAIVAIETLLGASSAVGTWTPQLRFGGGNTGMTGTFSGKYLRLGNAIFVSGLVILTAKGSSTGVATVALPFAAGSPVVGYLSTYWFATATNYVHVGIYTQGGTSNGLVLAATAAASAPTQISDTNFNNNSVLSFSGLYFA